MHRLFDRLHLPERYRRPGLLAAVASVVVLAVVVVAVLATRGDDGPSTRDLAAVPTTAATAGAPTTGATGAPAGTGAVAAATPPAGSCIVTLHGKGGKGAATVTTGTVARLSPEGNADGWGGRQWLYFPDASYAAARTVVADAVRTASCTRVVLDGFSNGGAFAAKLYCRGETFDGRLVGVKVDDPVTDAAVRGCTPATGVRVVLYWTGALEGDAKPGWACSKADWTCEGGSTLGIVEYAKALGTTALRSPNRDHAAYTTAPEPLSWLAAG